MLIYLIRHGQTDYNITGRYQGMYGESRLTEEGKGQARALAPLLAPLSFDRVFCSTAHRARETLSLAMPSLSQENVTFLDEMRELHVGSLTDLYVKDVKESYPDFFASLDPQRIDYSRFGGESHEDISARAQAVLRKWEKTGVQSIAAVSHGAFLWYLISVSTGLPIHHYQSPLSNCSVSVLELTNGTGRLRLFNLTAGGLLAFGKSHAL